MNARDLRFPQMTICGVEELDGLDLGSFTHVISIWDPVWETRDGHEDRFRRKLAENARAHFVFFDDIPTAVENRFAPAYEQIQEILVFTKPIEPSSSVLIHCWAGISRSTAVGYALLCQIAGPGKETECLAHLKRLRPQAIPNSLIVTLAEVALGRDGSMYAAYEEMMSRLLINCNDDEL